MAAKQKEKQLLDAKAKKEKLLCKKEEIISALKKEEIRIKQLEKELKTEQVEAAIKRIEIGGFQVEEILDELEKKAQKREENISCTEI